MLLSVTPNPALDRTIVVPNLHIGQRHRVEHVLVTAGGKGLNVARTAQVLGQPCTACAPLGGFTGQYVAHLAHEEGLHGHWYWHNAGETRTCILVVDPHAHDATPLDEHGPQFSADEWQVFVETVLAVAATSRPSDMLVTVCGSLPPGVPPAALADLLHALAGSRVLVDTSGNALEAALNAAPFAVKVNAAELSAVLGQPVTTLQEATDALACVRSRGVALALVSLGEQGAVAQDDTTTWYAKPPPLEIVSTVGSGDALTAGLATGLLRGQPLAEALRLGVACGAANTLTPGGGAMETHTLHTVAANTSIQVL